MMSSDMTISVSFSMVASSWSINMSPINYHDGLHWTEAELQSISCDFSASLLPLLLSLSLSKTQIANRICPKLQNVFVFNWNIYLSPIAKSICLKLQQLRLFRFSSSSPLLSLTLKNTGGPIIQWPVGKICTSYIDLRERVGNRVFRKNTFSTKK